MEYETLVGFNAVNRQVSPFITNIGDLSEVQNLRTDKIGVLSKSFDYSIKGAQITSGQDIIGAVDFQRNDGTHEHFVAIDGASNAEIYKYVTDTWTSQSQSLTAGSKVRFAYSPTIDTLFACNYDDATRSYNGSSWSTSTNVTDAAQGRYPIAFGDRIYILNCYVGGTAYPSRGYRSDAIETAATWDTAEYIVFEDAITGVNMNGENMFVTCQNSTWIFTLADERFQMSSIGGVSHESIVAKGRYTFYAARDGYYAFDGRETFKVSSAIEDYWKKIPESNFDNIQAVTKGDHIYIYIGDITAPWDSNVTLQNVIFDYNTLQNNWSRGKLGTGATNLHQFVESTGQEIFMGDEDGSVFQMFDGSGQQNGVDYESALETHWFYGSGANVEDDWLEVWGYGDYLSGLKVSYKTEEREDWKPVGELNADTDVAFMGEGVRSYKIKLRLAEHSGKNLFDLHRLDVGYMSAYEKNEDREG